MHTAVYKIACQEKELKTLSAIIFSLVVSLISLD